MASSNDLQQETSSLWSPPGYFVYDGVPYTSNMFSTSVLEACKRLKFRVDDVIIASYPKTGTTWLQEIVYLVCNDADTDKAKASMIGDRVPCIEHAFKGKRANIHLLEEQPGQRLMFTHLRSTFFGEQIKEGKGKAILLIRNAKDTLTSYYHFYKLAVGYPGDWPSFFELFRNKQLIYGDFYDWCVDWLPLSCLPNALVLRYEDMKRQHAATVEVVSRFLDRALSADQIQRIVEATSFAAMKQNPTTNQKQNPTFDHRHGDFIRKGEVGDWKNYFDHEQSLYIDKLDEQILKPLALNLSVL